MVPSSATTFLLLSLATSSVLTATTATFAKTATAIIHEHNGIWGSIVFHQWNPQSPVFISILFRNVKIRQDQQVDWKIHEEPVHYDLFPSHTRCGDFALKSVMRLEDKQIGELGLKHGMITSSRFAQVLYDWDISLYDESKTNIIGKSFVIRQGDKEADYKCATIQSTAVNSFRPGLIPCEMVHYTDCLVGTAKDDVCVYRPCVGYRQYWGEVDETTTLCAQHEEVFPKALEEPQVKEGVIKCRHGKHTLLMPADGRDMES